MNFSYLLQSLMHGTCDSLYNYNQYVLKRFFDYAIEDDRYVEEVRHGRTGLKKNHYCPKHEVVLMTACVSTLNKDEGALFREYYLDYITFKTGFMGWRGRADWFDFHRTILSHLIWSENIDLLYWTWDKITEKMRDFKRIYPGVSDWRRRWYLLEISKLRLYLISVCVTCGKIDVLNCLFSKKIVKNNKEAGSLLCKLGYVLEDDKLKSAEFTYTVEWKWLLCEVTDPKKVDPMKCLGVCMKSNFNKARLITLLNERDIRSFWKLFLTLDARQMTFLTSKSVCGLLNSKRHDVLDYKLKYKIILKVFSLSRIITHTLLRSIHKALHEFCLSSKCGSDLVISAIKEDENSDFYYLKNFCDIFISNGSAYSNQTSSLNADGLFWAHVLLGKRIENMINMTILKHRQSFFNSTDACPICLTDIGSDVNCTLPCGHSFHVQCICADINIGRTRQYLCPMCRCKVSTTLISSSTCN